MRKMLLGAFLVFMIPFSAMAQLEYPTAEIFGGYSYFRANPEEFNLHGWNTSVTGNVTDWFGIEGDFSGHYGHPSDEYGTIPGIDIDHYTFMAGPRLSYRAGSVTPFAHFLIGAARASTKDAYYGNISDWALGTVVGGGVDINISSSIAVRAAQLDWLMTRYDTGQDYYYYGHQVRQNNFRFSAGIVIRLGSR